MDHRDTEPYGTIGIRNHPTGSRSKSFTSTNYTTMSSSSRSRPEGSAPPDLFYDGTEARKYHANSRMQTIQTEIAERAIEMLQLPEGRPALVLDIGCGSGLSGEVLEEKGYTWIGCDISRDMLQVRVIYCWLPITPCSEHCTRITARYLPSVTIRHCLITIMQFTQICRN